MQKILLTLMLIFSVSVSAQASWNPYLMDHDRFVHLSADEKQMVLIKTMEMMVEMESKFTLQVTAEHRAEQYKKYVQILFKLQSMILSNAYANDSEKSLKEVAAQFQNLLKNKTLQGKICIYGGYISKIVSIDATSGLKACTHPGRLVSVKNPKTAEEKAENALDQEIRKAYLSNQKKDSPECSTANLISCNPVVFGFAQKPNAAGAVTPFCVPTSPLVKGKPHNVSYECMKKSLEVKDKDNKSVALKNLSVFLSDKESKKVFNEIHNYIFQSCVCGSTNMNEEYGEYIRPHRTCYGMINTLRVLDDNSCSILNKKDFAFPEKWQNYFAKDKNFSRYEDQKFSDFEKNNDNEYKNLFDEKTLAHLCPDLGAGNSGPGPVKSSGPTPAGEKDPQNSCTTEVVHDEKDLAQAIIKVNFNLIDKMNKPVFKEDKISTPDAKDPTLFTVKRIATKQDLKLTFTLQDAAKSSVICEATVRALGDDEKQDPEDNGQKHSISVSKDGKDNPYSNDVPVTALIDGKPEIPEGHKVSWTRKGKGIKPKMAVPEKSTAVGDSSPSDVPAGEPVTPEDPNSADAPEHLGKTKFPENRDTAPFDLCATLKDAAGKTQGKESCVTIDPKRAPPQRGVSTPGAGFLQYKPGEFTIHRKE